MATLSQRIKAAVQAIGADIKAISAKTNLLKSAAYRDVGTTDGKIPEFVGVNGISGLGYAGAAKKLAAGSDLNLLPNINAIYTANKNDNILNRPAEMSSYIFSHEFVVECIVGNTSGAYATYIQRLSFNAFPPEGTNISNTVVFIRSSNYAGFSPWVRTTGTMYGIDVGGDVVGDDVAFNTVKVGATSPKIAFERVRLDITYANFGYNEDGITSKNPNYDSRGYQAINSSVPATRILDLSLRLYGPIYKNYGDSSIKYAQQGAQGNDTYIEATMNATGEGYLINVKTAAHSIELLGNTDDSGENFFDGGYVELFVTYKVD